MGKGKNKGKQSQTRVVGHSTLTNPDSLPLPFPCDCQVPDGRFLRDEGKYHKSFQIALKTSYEGFVVDTPEETVVAHVEIEASLEQLQASHFFRTDVTQPFGLGTKCATTYVTRCLLGERGTTYKYLGLRLFGHPWDGLHEKDAKVQKALQSIQLLNQHLTKRLSRHLTELDQTRRKRNGQPVKGRAGFDICLINRMECSTDLKPEPSTGEGRCSVSWHADSSLEHYSSIAVYQTLSHEGNEKGKWSIGLRVAHNSEGPQASRRGTDIVSSIVTETPPIAVSLPSRSTYYLLDDFNHHHQHVVLAEGEVEGVRYSSTHRLLRDSHNVSYVLERCKSTVASFHKKGIKVWRSEQLLLTDIESEWIRQFFVQGTKHYNLLWKSWGEPIQQILGYWSQLEERTRQTIELLRLGAEGKCKMEISQNTVSREERKLRDKRKKALVTLEELVSRASENSDMFESLAGLLDERAKMRELWGKREKDHAFTKIDHESRPLPIPFYFASCSSEAGHSRMIADVSAIASELRAFGKAFETSKECDLPNLKTLKYPVDANSDPHAKEADWNGWNTALVGLEMQEPWASLLLDGSKSIETRAYNLPSSLLGKRIEILQSGSGDAGISSLGNFVRLDSGLVKRVGWVVFDSVIKYSDKVSFKEHESKHLVEHTSAFGWKDDVTTLIYGWVVVAKGQYQLSSQAAAFDRAERRMRSLFELFPRDTAKRKPGQAEKSKKEKRGRF